MPNEKIAFVPFHTLNEFMTPEYREEVLRVVFSKLNDLSQMRKSLVNRAVKNDVNVPGFRNSSLAPLALKVRGAAKAFAKNPEFTAQILSAWLELNPELSKRVYELLKGRGWEVLPIEADRTRLPGFMVRWPAGDSYETLGQAFSERWPESTFDVNDIRLMIVWLSGRLPYNMDESSPDDPENEMAA
ncbi:MAG: hypothetical protein HPY59_11410 [Anaerolineae bacterium]|nr:hypothetical protein [Anaerolineae bacterium]